MGENLNKNNFYTKAAILVALVLLFTLFFNLIPRFIIFDKETKKVDILSELRAERPSLTTDSQMDSALYVSVSDEIITDNPSLIIKDSINNTSTDTLLTKSNNISESLDNPEVDNSLKEVIGEKVQEKIDSIVDTEPLIKEVKISNKIVDFEDYSENGIALENFRKAIANANNEVVRIGLIGDSFIEGDILSGDVREMLQDEYGGSGVGFVPTTSIVSKYRATISHTFSGWKAYSIKSNNSAIIDNKFIISSNISTPLSDSVRLEYKTSATKRHLKNCTKAYYYFINEGETEISVIINGNERKKITPESSTELQRIDISSDSTKYIASLSFSLKNSKNFYSYGVSLESETGIIVDNFSERGSSGMPLMKLSPLQNKKFNSYGNYKLLILQFGLNVLSYGRYDYKYFENKLVSVVEKIKESYPDATIIIMGISDRNVKIDNEYKPMIKEIEQMTKHQKSIAKRTESIYWSTSDAMKFKGGIKTFVKNNWAAKDHVHVNVKGARMIAEQFIKSLKRELNSSKGETNPLRAED